MSFQVTLYDKKGEKSTDLILPFVPFPGLRLQALWKNGGDYVTVGEVYWDTKLKLFEIYEETEEEQTCN